MRRGLHLRRQRRYGVAWVVENGDYLKIEFADPQEYVRCNWAERAPQFDRYAPGPVPIAVLLSAGWWFECGYCGHRVSEDGCDDCRDEGHDAAPVVLDQVYCNERCRDLEVARHAEHKRREAECRVRGRAEVVRRWPDATVISVWPSPEYVAQIDFTFPGGLGRVRWDEGSEHVYVEKRDVEAWHLFDARCAEARREGGER
jgi:hypothetical protein